MRFKERRIWFEKMKKIYQNNSTKKVSIDFDGTRRSPVTPKEIAEVLSRIRNS